MGNQLLIAQRYRIDDVETDRIGRGGMGDVYRATDTETAVIVAVKRLKAEFLADSNHMVLRFEREAEALRRLNHPNIVAVLDSVSDADGHYIIMEYVAGGSLEDLLHREKRLPVEQVLKIGLELADALTRAHHLNIIHRDIKPANVLLTKDGSPRLTDFGVAHLEDLARITQTGMLTGTYAYISPEGCDGQTLDARADLWSFGVMLYEMLAGKRPFTGEHITATITAILTKPIPDLAQLRPDAPEELTSLIYRMLAKNREQRIGSARMVGAQLEEILSGVGRMETNMPRFDTTTPSGPIAPRVGPRHNLPRQPTPFVGRAPEIVEITALLRDPDCRLLTLLGPGGMGKTRLSIESSEQVADDFTHGVRFVALADVDAPEFMVTAVAESLKLTLNGDDDPQEQLRNYVRDKEMLLVMDNFEHLLDGADLVSDLLADAPRLKVLATSRETLNLWEEWVQPVQGMRYPEDPNNITDIDAFSAIKLFAERARRMRRGFSLEEELPYVVQICDLVEGMPLGIELAATWLRTLSPQQIVHEMEKSIDFLATSMRNIAPRHRSIRAVFDYSWNLLTPDEQAALPKLSIFRGGFDRQAADAVADASLITLTGLVEKSLLHEVADEVADTKSHAKLRYGMHELLKQYAAEKLAADEEITAVTEQKYAAHYALFLHNMRNRIHSPKIKQYFETITADLENIRAAWAWSVAHVGDASEAVVYLGQSANVITTFYAPQGFFREGIGLYEQAILALEEMGDKRPFTNAIIGKIAGLQGILYRAIDHIELSRQRIEKAVALLTAVNETNELDAETTLFLQQDLATFIAYNSFFVRRSQSNEAGLAMAHESIALSEKIEYTWGKLIGLNFLASHIDDPQEKKKLLRQHLKMSREVGDPMSTGLSIINYASYADTPDEAEVLLQEAVQLYQQTENRTGLAWAYMNLGNRALEAGKYRRAKSYNRKSWQIFADVGARQDLFWPIWGVVQASWAMGDLKEVNQLLEETLELMREWGDLEKIIRALHFQAIFKLELDDFKRASRNYKEAVAILPGIKSPLQRAEALDSLGNMALLLGKYNQAREHFSTNVNQFHEAGNLSGAAWALRNLGIISYRLGDYDAATEKYKESLALHEQVSDSWAEVTLLTDLGQAAYAAGSPDEAGALYKKALTRSFRDWFGAAKLVTAVEWSALLMSQGEKERALEYLTIIRQSNGFAPPSVSKRDRDKAARLQAELKDSLPITAVAAATTRAHSRTPDDVVRELLAR